MVTVVLSACDFDECGDDGESAADNCNDDAVTHSGFVSSANSSGVISTGTGSGFSIVCNLISGVSIIMTCTHKC